MHRNPNAKEDPMNTFCHSCAVPLEMPGMKGASDTYCTNCSDATGALKPREAVRVGLAEWFKTWQPGVGEAAALERADHYLKAMPAWAD
jgi:hypothetical protein